MKLKLLSLAMAAALLAACSGPKIPTKIAIAGAKLLPGGGKPVIEFSIILIENGMIVEAGPQASVRMPKDYKIISGLGHQIEPLPGGILEQGQPANLVMRGAPRTRTMRQGVWED